MARPQPSALREAPDARGTAQADIDPSLIERYALDMGLALEPAQCRALADYARLLHRWNRVHNLTAIDNAGDLLSHHLLDCLAIIAPLEHALAQFATCFSPGRPLSFLDAGSGGGLPGIVLAIARPHWRGTLVDAVQKKCAFLQQAQVELALRNVAVRHERLETCSAPPSMVVVSRAFASLGDFTRLTGHLLAAGGIWAAMKGRDPTAEHADLPPGVGILETITLRVPMLEEQRRLVILQPAPPAAS